MNQRIRLLAEQAGLVGGGYANGTKIMTWRESFDNPGSLEKFAELLIRKCADFVAPLGDYCGGHGEPSAPSSRECAKRLKEHFGVEE